MKIITADEHTIKWYGRKDSANLQARRQRRNHLKSQLLQKEARRARTASCLKKEGSGATSSENLGATDVSAKGKTQESEPMMKMIDLLQGKWWNAERPSESYTVSGRDVARCGGPGGDQTFRNHLRFDPFKGRMGTMMLMMMMMMRMMMVMVMVMVLVVVMVICSKKW